jgi:AICAR transformylase/IMP cyclohydrolase PurH
MGIPVIPVENLTTYPSILGGRVKTLHPSVFGGILGRRDNETDVQEMKQYNIPELDLVIVDLYPFEQTLEEQTLKASSTGGNQAERGLGTEFVEEALIIEKIDIGGPSMIRGAAKNFKDVVVVAAKKEYAALEQLLNNQKGETTLEQRKAFAARAFEIVAHYDVAIAKYFNPSEALYFLKSVTNPKAMRYGENPHQSAVFYGDLNKLFDQLNGKELSYNNLVDVDAAVQLIGEWPPQTPPKEWLRNTQSQAPPNLPKGEAYQAQGPQPLQTSPKEGLRNTQSQLDENSLQIESTKISESSKIPPPTGGGGGAVFAIIKHTNVCGIAQRTSTKESWDAALEGDHESAFGGVLVTNGTVDKATAEAINEIFFEVLIAPAFNEDALAILKSKKNRILLQLKQLPSVIEQYKSVLNGVLIQGIDKGNYSEWKEEGARETTASEKEDLKFANLVCKHLKSNAIALVKNKQLVGKGCGQTSRIDSLRQSVEKAKQFNFDLKGAVMASDAFFPFNDCVQLGHQAGIAAFIQPGGSIRDKDSIEYCKEHGLAMVITGLRHFKHG